MAGNLQYFVGTVLGGTGYVRDREAEFGRRDVPRAELDRELAKATAVVRETLASVSAATLAAPYPVAVQQVQVSTELWLLHLVAHLAFHLGQAGYLRRLLLEDSRSAGAVPVRGLVDDIPS